MTTPRIRVLFVVNSLGRGGAEKHAVTLLNHLDARCFELSLVYLKNKDSLLAEIDQRRLRHTVCLDVRARIDLRAVGRLANIVRSAGIDVLVCSNAYSMLYGQLAKARARRSCKSVVVFHTTLLASTKDRLQMMFYRPFFRASDLLVYVCEAQRDHWQAKRLRARSECVIENGVDVEHFSCAGTKSDTTEVRARYGFTRRDYVIGLCANMRPEKAHGDLLLALGQLHSRGIEARCLLIGDGPARSIIERKIEALGLGGKVVITGFLKDVRPAMLSCDVMVLPSHYVETFSVAALEAMALERPMVMTDIGGASEQVRDGETGFLYAPGDIGRLSDILAELSDRNLSRSMGGRARERVGRLFTQERMVHEFQNRLLAVSESGSTNG